VEVKRVGDVVARVTIRERKRTKEMRDGMVRRAIVAGCCLEREVFETEGWFGIEEWCRDGRLYIQNREEEAGENEENSHLFQAAVEVWADAKQHETHIPENVSSAGMQLCTVQQYMSGSHEQRETSIMRFVIST